MPSYSKDDATRDDDVENEPGAVDQAYDEVFNPGIALRNMLRVGRKIVSLCEAQGDVSSAPRVGYSSHLSPIVRTPIRRKSRARKYRNNSQAGQTAEAVRVPDMRLRKKCYCKSTRENSMGRASPLSVVEGDKKRARAPLSGGVFYVLRRA